MIPYIFYGVYDGVAGGLVTQATTTGGSNYNTTGHTTNTITGVTFASDTDFIAVDVMWTHFSSPAAISGVTIDGKTAAAISGTDTGALNAGTWIRQQSWGLVDPSGAGVTLGSAVNVVVTFAATVSVSQNVAQGYKGVDQTTPTEGGANSGLVAAGAGTKTQAPSTTTVAGDYLFGGYINFGGSTADVSTVDNQLAENWDSNNGTITNTADSAIAGSGETLGWTDLTFYNWAAHVFVIKAASPTTNYTNTVTENLGVADSSTQLSTYTSSVTENLSLSDAPAITVQFVVTRTEPLTMADTSAITVQFVVTRTEPITLADSSTQIYAYTSNITENISLADIISAGNNNFTNTVTENINVADINTISLQINIFNIENITLIDLSSVASQLIISIIENVSNADTIASQTQYFEAVNENFTELDSIFTPGWVTIIAGNVAVWNPINDAQTNSWIDVVDTQNPNWIIINDNQ